MNVEFRKEAHSITLGGIPPALGGMIAPIGGLVAARVIGAGVALVLALVLVLVLVLQRIDREKVVYNWRVLGVRSRRRLETRGSTPG